MRSQAGITAGISAVNILFFAYLALPAFAATLWVSPTGTASYSSCASSTPLAGTSACSLAAVNSSAVAGDLINLRAGTYTTGIAPSNSGTGTLPSGPFSFITFQAYPGETPTFSVSGGGTVIDLTGLAYIRINGITVNYGGSGYTALLRNGSNHNEIENSTFNSTNGHNMLFYVASLATSSSGPWATHNWIHNNTFNTSGQAHGTNGTGCTDGGGDVMDVGHAYSSTYAYEADNYNTVENNVFNHAPHATIENYGMYTVFRNNVTHNEPWSPGCPTYTYPPTYSSSNPNFASYNGSYGHRDVEFDDDFVRVATYDLIEGDRFGNAGANDTNGGADDFSLAAPQNIVRYNFFFAAMNPGLRLKGNWNGGAGGFGHGGTYNRVYNNTFYQNGYGYTAGATCGTNSCPWGQSSIGTENTSANVLVNNILYLSYSYTARGWDIDSEGAPSNGWSTLEAMHNWCTGVQKGGDFDMLGEDGCTGVSAQGDPKFTNPDLTNPSSTTLPDLSLQATSPAIDGGTYLTTATNSGTKSVTLTVADALYFQDGTWGSDLSRSTACLGGTMQADSIAIGTVTNIVKISSVTYGTYSAPAGTITLASPTTWSSGAPIWLYSKSDGSIVLVGAAPDYGASEYGASSTPATPTCVKAALQ
jgi:hypothetical protein